MPEHRTGQRNRAHQPAAQQRDSAAAEELLRRFLRCRKRTLALVAPLEPEDYGLQGMADASPPKWHLAHTSWFFDTFVLAPHHPSYRPFHPQFHYLFNSYYLGEGQTFARAKRGMLSRPSLDAVLAYRRFVDDGIAELLSSGACAPELWQRVLLGIHHECQHQELILTDIKYSLFQNPLRPSIMEPDGELKVPLAKPGPEEPGPEEPRPEEPGAGEWLTLPAGIVTVGRDLPPAYMSGPEDFDRFAFDNESPRHQFHRPAVALRRKLATNGEFAAFIADGGYQRPELWLAEGFQFCQDHGITAPLYWLSEPSEQAAPQGGTAKAWFRYGLRGIEPLAEAAPVSHISLYEADAFARWQGARLPTEQEWESAVADQPVAGNLLPDQLGDGGQVAEPRASRLVGGEALPQAFGDVWEWTQSSYSPYPGFKTAKGSIGEYNGKFMVNQYVLKGGSSFTPAAHIRSSYRNFFHASARWQNTGVRLAKDLP